MIIILIQAKCIFTVEKFPLLHREVSQITMSAKTSRHHTNSNRVPELTETHENSNVERRNHQSDYRSTCIKDENSRSYPFG